MTFGIRSKIWLEVDGEAVFGAGRRRLLEAIAAHGSINRAARDIGVSYRKAWSNIAAMEQRLGFRLVERRTGGRNGGGTRITDAARCFLAVYGEIEERVRDVADEAFDRVVENLKSFQKDSLCKEVHHV